MFINFIAFLGRVVCKKRRDMPAQYFLGEQEAALGRVRLSLSVRSLCPLGAAIQWLLGNICQLPVNSRRWSCVLWRLMGGERAERPTQRG